MYHDIWCNMQYSKITYNEKGLIDGEHRTYFDNGNICQIYNFKDEKPHGLQTEYWPNGNKLGECTFDNGNREGRYSEWYENGQLSYTVMYDNDTEVGDGISWNVDGSIKYEIDFVTNMMTSYSDTPPRTFPFKNTPWRLRNENAKKYTRWEDLDTSVVPIKVIR